MDANPKEQFVYHAAGAGGYGGSSYIDHVALRDKDSAASWNNQASATLTVRTYYCQNWRADVVAIVTAGGTVQEFAKYSAYGVPFGMPQGDTDSDGDCDATDEAQATTWSGSTYDVRADLDFDGDVDDNDVVAIQENADTAYGRGVLSDRNGGNRKGYAGYEFDDMIGLKYHVRHRVLDASLGRWLQRDPLGDLVQGSFYAYANGAALSQSDYSGLVSGGIPWADPWWIALIAQQSCRLQHAAGAVESAAVNDVGFGDDDCCKGALKWVDPDEEGGVSGLTVCCDGEVKICAFNPVPKKYRYSPGVMAAGEMARECAAPHEQVHARCAWCPDPTVGGFSVPIMDGVDYPEPNNTNADAESERCLKKKREQKACDNPNLSANEKINCKRALDGLIDAHKGGTHNK